VDKFDKLVSHVMGPSQTRAIRETVLNFDAVPDASELNRLLAREV